MSPTKQPKKDNRVRRFSKAFRKDDARHYIIYSFLSKWKLDYPYTRAEEILEALKDNRLL